VLACVTDSHDPAVLYTNPKGDGAPGANLHSVLIDGEESVAGDMTPEVLNGLSTK